MKKAANLSAFLCDTVAVKIQKRCFTVNVEDFAKTMAGRSYSGTRATTHPSRKLLECHLTTT